MVASPHGGVNIEEVAKETPSEIYKEGVDILSGKHYGLLNINCCLKTWLLCMLQVANCMLPLLHSFYFVVIFLGMSREQAVNMARRLGFSEECVEEVSCCTASE